MGNRISAWLLVSALVVATLMVANTKTYASEGQEKAVKEAVTHFFAALNDVFKGDLGPMKGVWSHADDVTYMGPTGGFQVGWHQVLANWEKQAAMKLGGNVEPEGMRITVGRVIAVANNYEKGENTNVEGKSSKVSIRATNVFRKEHGKWKVIGHHTDLLPYLEKK